MNDQSLRVLMVEDSESDELLIIRELKEGGYAPVYERVETVAEMKKALKEKQWDIILCNHIMPKFSAPSALALLKKENIDIPVIIISGAIGEEQPIECMHLGARDYIMKNNMSRLCPAIDRELKEKYTTEKLKFEEQRFRIVAEQSSDIMILLNREGIITYENPAVETILGFKVEEMIGTTGLEHIHPDDVKLVTDKYNMLLSDINAAAQRADIRFRHKDGSWRMFEGVASNLIHNNVIEGIIVNLRDITGRKQMEDSLRTSEENFRLSLDDSPLGVRISTIDGETIYANRAILDIYGYDSIEELKNTPLKERYTPESYAEFQLRKEKRLRGEFGPSEYKIDIVRKNGEIRHLHVLRKEIFWNGERQFQIMYQDITKHKRAEEKCQLTLETLREAISTNIQVMVSSIEMRDPYTAGHLNRVADLARAIAMEMGLPQDKIEGIRMAGSIHDIGNLSIPAELLAKPTKLTNLEFSLIKEHAKSGYEMLKNVESPWPLAQIVYQHHERMNGIGYPRNLKGSDIIIEARIIAVADVVEAMVSQRPYRRGLGIDTALNEIEKNRGFFYDDAVSDACLRLFWEEGYQLK